MPKISNYSRHLAENVIRGMLRVGGGTNHELPIIAKLFQPAGNIGGLILDDRRRDSGLGAQIGGSHLCDQLFDAVGR